MKVFYVGRITKNPYYYPLKDVVPVNMVNVYEGWHESYALERMWQEKGLRTKVVRCNARTYEIADLAGIEG